MSRSVTSDSLPPRGLQPTRLLCPWDSAGDNTGVDCHALLQGIFLTQGSKPGSPTLQADSLLSEPPGEPSNTVEVEMNVEMGEIRGAHSEDVVASVAYSQVLRVCGSRLGFLSEGFMWKAAASHPASIRGDPTGCSALMEVAAGGLDKRYGILGVNPLSAEL